MRQQPSGQLKKEQIKLKQNNKGSILKKFISTFYGDCENCLKICHSAGMF